MDLTIPYIPSIETIRSDDCIHDVQPNAFHQQTQVNFIVFIVVIEFIEKL